MTISSEEAADNFLLLPTWEHQKALLHLSDQEFFDVTPTIERRLKNAGLGNYAEWLLSHEARRRGRANG